MIKFNDTNRNFPAKFGESLNVNGGGGGGDGLPNVTEEDNGKLLAVQAGKWAAQAPANAVERDNTRPITSAAVYTTIGNINTLLETI